MPLQLGYKWNNLYIKLLFCQSCAENLDLKTKLSCETWDDLETSLMPVFQAVKKVIEEKTPILGICLGMQLFTKFSEEGDAGGLGWIDARTIKFNLGDKFRVPHMGWNNIKIEKDNKIFSNLNKEDYFYFVHSFHVNCKNKEDILSITEYGKKFISAIQKENIIGVQFHPEKSHDAGLEILKNFAEET